MEEKVEKIRKMKSELLERMAKIKHQTESNKTIKFSIYRAIVNGLDDITEDVLENLDDESFYTTVGFIEFLGQTAKKTLGV